MRKLIAILGLTWILMIARGPFVIKAETDSRGSVENNIGMERASDELTKGDMQERETFGDKEEEVYQKAIEDVTEWEKSVIDQVKEYYDQSIENIRKEDSLTLEEKRVFVEKSKLRAFEEYHYYLMTGLTLTMAPVKEEVPFHFEDRNLDTVEAYIQKELIPDFSIKDYYVTIEEYHKFHSDGTIRFQYFIKGFKTDHFMSAAVKGDRVTEISWNKRPETLTLPEITREITEAEVIRLALLRGNRKPEQIEECRVTKCFSTITGKIFYAVHIQPYDSDFGYEYYYDLN